MMGSVILLLTLLTPSLCSNQMNKGRSAGGRTHGHLFVRATRTNSQMSMLKNITTSTCLVEALRLAGEYKKDDVVQIINLKQQKNESLQIIVKLMNNTFGVILENETRKRKNRIEIRVQSILFPTRKAFIKSKYVTTPFPNIYVHDTTELYQYYVGFDPDSFFNYTSSLIRVLKFDENKDVISFHADINYNKLAKNMSHGLIFQYQWILDKFRLFNASNSDSIKECLVILSAQSSSKFYDSLITKLYSSSKIKLKLKTAILPKLRDLKNSWQLFETEIFLETLIINKIGIYLKKSAEYHKFWIVFQEVLIERCKHVIKENLSTKPVQIGSSIQLDVVNTYLLRSIAMKRDLHVIVSNMDYNGVLSTLIGHFPVEGTYRFKKLLVGKIVKRVEHQLPNRTNTLESKYNQI